MMDTSAVLIILGGFLSLLYRSNTLGRIVYAKEKKVFADKKINTNILELITSRSLTDCTRHCLQNIYCMSLFYQKQKRLCQLHSVEFIDTSLAENFEGWKYYSVKNELCVGKWDYVQNRKLNTCYKYFPLEKIDVTTYKTKCQNDGAELVKIDSQIKQDHLGDFLQHLPDSYICIQGSDSIRERTWQFDDGTPMTYTNWNIDEQQPDDQHHTEAQDCLFIRKQFNFTWNDLGCFYLDQYAAFLCEILH